MPGDRNIQNVSAALKNKKCRTALKSAFSLFVLSNRIPATRVEHCGGFLGARRANKQTAHGIAREMCKRVHSPASTNRRLTFWLSRKADTKRISEAGVRQKWVGKNTKREGTFLSIPVPCAEAALLPEAFSGRPLSAERCTLTWW